MASLREQVESILNGQPVIPSDDNGRILSGSESAAGGNGNSNNGSESSYSASSPSNSRPEAVNPNTASSTVDDAAPSPSSSRNRSRTRNSGTSASSRSRKPSTEEATFHIGDLILLLNNLLAFAIGMKELKISEEEATAMGNAAKRLSKFYSATAFSPIQLAWINMLGTLGVIYAPKVWEVMQREPEPDEKAVAG